MVGQNGKYYDHVYCMEGGQQIKFCVANYFRKRNFPPFQQTAKDSNTTRFEYVSFLQLQEIP